MEIKGEHHKTGDNSGEIKISGDTIGGEIKYGPNWDGTKTEVNFRVNPSEAPNSEGGGGGGGGGGGAGGFLTPELGNPFWWVIGIIVFIILAKIVIAIWEFVSWTADQIGLMWSAGLFPALKFLFSFEFVGLVFEAVLSVFEGLLSPPGVILPIGFLFIFIIIFIIACVGPKRSADDWIKNLMVIIFIALILSSLGAMLAVSDWMTDNGIKSWGGLFGVSVIQSSLEVEVEENPTAIQKTVEPALASETCQRNPTLSADTLDIFERVCVARKMLQEKQTEIKLCPVEREICKGKGKKQKCQTVVVGQRFCDRSALSVLLAVMDQTDGVITIITIKDESPLPGYTVRRLSNNGLNSEYAVAVPPGQVVVGIQYPILVATQSGMQPSLAYYVPYSRELEELFPSLAKIGDLYLREVIDRAYQVAKIAQVDVSAVPNDFLYTLTMIAYSSSEVVDETAVASEMSRIQTTIGANGAEAYRYAVSSQKARGLCQIIPVTYRSLRERYPALLTADFFDGTANHLNAVTAQLLLAKEDLGLLFSQPNWRGDETKQKIFLADSRHLGEYLAIAYNGGGPRAVRWENSERTMMLPDETAKYLAKFGQVRDVLYSLSSKREVTASMSD